MKVLDVHAFETGMDETRQNITTLSSQLKQTEESVNQLISLSDAFKGEGPQAILSFFEQYHTPLLKTYHTFCADYQLTIEQIRNALFGCEPAPNGFIRQSFLENELKQGLIHARTITIELTDEANAIMQTVSDIVSLPPLREDSVVRACDEANQFKQQTIEKLVQFDILQTKALTPLESLLQSITNQIQFMDDIFIQGDTSVHVKTTAVEGLSCERPETEIKENKAWYEVVWNVILGAIEGIVKAVVDIFKGLFDLLKSLFTDPIGFFKGIVSSIFNPVDTFNAMWGAVETAWERDVINGDARSRASFFTYAIVSVVGLKGIDKLGKVGKLDHTASKVDNNIPYNAFRTDKLKELVKTNVYANMQQKAKQTADLLKSNFGKEAINKTIQAAKNSEIITKARNTLNPTNIKAASTKLYADVVKAPIAKTQDWMQTKKKEQILKAPLSNVGPIPLGPTTNMTVRYGIEAAKDTVLRMVRKNDGGEERTKGQDKPLQNSIETNVKNISPEDRKKLEGWKYPPSDEKYLKYKEIYDNNKYYNQETGEVNWPPNNGFDGKPFKYELQVGAIIDRYGNPDGTFLSPGGTPYEQRALALHSDEAPYHKYIVLVPFEVEAGKILPWFDRPGEGSQYYTGNFKIQDEDTGMWVIATVENLERLEYIQKIK